MRFDVFGMCNPLFDIQAEISDDVLAGLGFEKGTMRLIDEGEQKRLVATIYENIVNAESGGSGANTMIGLAQLGGSGCFTGKLGNDEHGVLYAQSLTSRNVHLPAIVGNGTTGICVVLITPDAERTLCTFLGISRELGPDDLDRDSIASSKYIYITGYLWDTESQQAAVVRAMEIAKEHGVKVALSLSDPFCVGRHKEAFLSLTEQYVDLLIGNHEEMQALTGCSTPEAAILATSSIADMAAVTVGAKGSIIRSGNSLCAIGGFQVDPVDTTGAGDMYAAGLLYGLTHDLSIEHTGKLAGYVASRVVASLGPRLSSLDDDYVTGLLTRKPS